MRATARSLATVLRIKVHLTRGEKRRQKQNKREKKMSSFCNKTVRARRSNAFHLLSAARLYSQSPLLLSFFGMNENARLGAIKRGSPLHRRLRSPLSLRSLHSSLRNHFGPSLGCQTRENWEVGVGALGGGRRGLRGARERPPSQKAVNYADNQLSTNQPTNQATRPALEHPTRLALPCPRLVSRRVPPRPLNQKLCAECASQCVCLDSTINIKQQLRGRTLV